MSAAAFAVYGEPGGQRVRRQLSSSPRAGGPCSAKPLRCHGARGTYSEPCKGPMGVGAAGHGQHGSPLDAPRQQRKKAARGGLT